MGRLTGVNDARGEVMFFLHSKSSLTTDYADFTGD
jgi:hypothetical protein